MPPLFTGVGVALVSLFDDDRRLDTAATADLAGRLIDEVEQFQGDIYVGNTTMLTLGGAIGVTGAILVLANAEPEKCIAAFEGDGKAQVQLAAPHRASMVGFPAGIKQLVADRFGVSAVARIGR
jgi:4-hydroxy-tetrahydrodipicolinate synthase